MGRGAFAAETAHRTWKVKQVVSDPCIRINSLSRRHEDSCKHQLNPSKVAAVAERA